MSKYRNTNSDSYFAAADDIALIGDLSSDSSDSSDDEEMTEVPQREYFGL